VAGAQLVVGDRFGQSCAGTLAAGVFAASAAAGRFAAHNRPYAGGYGLERHAAPRDGVHAMQLEICRSAYLDAALREPGEGFDSMVALLAEVVRKLAAQVAAMGALQPRSGTSDWAQAAE
jgi:N-formylglutamate amidohydrolase